MRNDYELKSFILRSKNRQLILRLLSEKSRTAIDLVKLTKMYKSHVSRTLKELRDEGLIICLNPNDREYKFYKLSKKGKKVIT